MIDILFGIVIDNADVILEFLGFGAAAFIAYKVTDKITEGNLSEIFKSALRKRNEDILKKILGTTVQCIIKQNKGTVISLEVLESQCSDLKGKEVQIGSSEGIDSSLTVGRRLVLKV